MKKPFSIRTYLTVSYALLLIFSLGGIGFIWSGNEYRVITNGLQNLMRERVELLANVLGHEFAENGAIKWNQAELRFVNNEENLVATYIDNSGLLYELVPGSVSPRQEELFLEISSEHPVYQESFVMLVKPKSEATSIYAAAPVRDNQDQFLGVVCVLMPIGDLDSYIIRLRWLLVVAIAVVSSTPRRIW